MSKEFHHNGYVLQVNQKVECIYYHESIQYPNKIWLLDKPFEPVKFGIVIGDAGRRPYYLSNEVDNKELYLYIKFREYRFKKAIPISCIRDIKQSIASTERLIDANKDRIGEKGYSMEAFIALEQNIEKGKKFLL